MRLSQAQVFPGLVHGHASSAPSQETATPGKPTFSQPELGLAKWHGIVMGAVCPPRLSISPRRMLAQTSESWLAAPTHVHTLPKIGNGGNIKPSPYALTQPLCKAPMGQAEDFVDNMECQSPPLTTLLPKELYLRAHLQLRVCTGIPQRQRCCKQMILL